MPSFIGMFEYILFTSAENGFAFIGKQFIVLILTKCPKRRDMYVTYKFWSKLFSLGV